MKISKIKILSRKELDELGDLSEPSSNNNVIHHATLNGFDFDFTIEVEDADEQYSKILKAFLDWDLTTNAT